MSVNTVRGDKSVSADTVPSSMLCAVKRFATGVVPGLKHLDLYRDF